MTNISPASKPPPPGLRDETRMGNTVFTVFGYFKRDTSDNKKAKTWSPRSAGGTSSTRPDLMLMCGKVSHETFAELTAALLFRLFLRLMPKTVIITSNTT